MAELNHRYVHIVAGVATSVAIAGASILTHLAPPAATVIHHVAQVTVAHKYDWGALTNDEQSAAAQLIGDLDRREVEVFCGVPACQDLAEDIDQVMDMTHAASTVRRPIIEMGAGLGISPADDATRKIAAAIKTATRGRIDLQLIDMKQPGGGIVIALGQKLRAKR